MFKITFYYDYICPFSYIGSNRIQSLSKEYGMSVDWKGYEIHPDYPEQGARRKNTLRKIRVAESLRAVMEEEELKFKLPGFITNSRYALKAAELCKTLGKFTEFHNRCYEEYFLNRQNIGNKDTVLGIAEELDIDKEWMEKQLSTPEFDRILDNNRLEAHKIDVLGVPTVILNDFRVHGVQSVDLYRTLLKRFAN